MMALSGWLTCNGCGAVIGVGPIVDDDTIVDRLFDAAESAGWDVQPFGPDACATCKATPEHVARCAAVDAACRRELAGGGGR